MTLNESPQNFLEKPIQTLKGVGPKTFKQLQQKGLKTLKDLINFMPKKFLDTRQIYNISDIYEILESKGILFQEGIGITKTVQGIIIRKNIFATTKKKLKILELLVKDLKTEDKMIIKYFNQAYLNSSLKLNNHYVFFGKIVKKGASLIMINPKFEKYSTKLQFFGKIIPIYVSNSKYINNNKLRRLLYLTIEDIKRISEFIPSNYLKQYALIPIFKAYLKIHFPEDEIKIVKALERLQIQEILELLEEQEKYKYSSEPIPLSLSSNLTQKAKHIISKFENNYQINLTSDQRTAIEKILQAIKTNKANIFLYGDVGSGKTFVFLLISIIFLLENYNVFLLAPTKILAQQHYNTALQVFKIFKMDDRVELVSKKNKLKDEKPKLFIGTTAILYKTQPLTHKTALIGLDEEHKFGVSHREKLIEKTAQNVRPFFITISATPIPRTLAHNFYGYNEAIYIKKTPFKKQIITKLTKLERLPKVFAWLKKQLIQGQQAYIVFPRIDSESYDLTIENFSDLIRRELSPHSVEVLHGRMKNTQQQKIIQNFKDGTTKVLISTPLIEVGIDNPNAVIIIIFGAEMFGLAQLHQLRGRVGRKGQKSYCILIPNDNISAQAEQRLKAFSKIQNGLELAKLDLKNRGPGKIFGGIEQTGWNKLKIADPTNFYIINKSLKLYKDLKNLNIEIPKYITEE